MIVCPEVSLYGVQPCLSRGAAQLFLFLLQGSCRRADREKSGKQHEWTSQLNISHCMTNFNLKIQIHTHNHYKTVHSCLF